VKLQVTYTNKDKTKSTHKLDQVTPYTTTTITIIITITITITTTTVITTTESLISPL
jgi:hypothetical protein